ncbi:MAG: hypothetical protein IKP40_09005 [Clostridia bacterium]|nr:hypothetical protein [Clostridia bacterium]
MSLIGFLLRQSADITPYVRTANGEDIYGETETRACRLQRSRILATTYKNPDGEIDQVTAHAKMFCTGEPVPERSVVTVDGLSYTVIRCYRACGFGEDHLEMLLE